MELLSISEQQSHHFTETFKAFPSDILHCGPTDADIRYLRVLRPSEEGPRTIQR